MERVGIAPVLRSRNPFVNLRNFSRVLDQQRAFREEQKLPDAEKLNLIGERGFLLTRPVPMLDRVPKPINIGTANSPIRDKSISYFAEHFFVLTLSKPNKASNAVYANYHRTANTDPEDLNVSYGESSQTLSYSFDRYPHDLSVLSMERASGQDRLNHFRVALQKDQASDSWVLLDISDDRMKSEKIEILRRLTYAAAKTRISAEKNLQ